MKPWLTEPNSKEFESNGLKCHITRHPSLLHLCGYVAIPKTHRLYGKGYYELYDMGINIDVHGGLTYASQENDDWVFGFDCAHLYDLVPSSIMNGWNNSGDTYRDMQYVENETRELAQQLSELSV